MVDFGMPPHGGKHGGVRKLLHSAL